MIYWLIANIVLWVCCYALHRSSQNGASADDRIAPDVLSAMVGIVGAVSSIAYLGAAFWLHRFV